MTARSALVFVDCQVAVLRECIHGTEITQRCMQLVQRARREGVPVIWVQHEDDDVRDLAAGEIDETKWLLLPLLKPHDGEPVIVKRHKDSIGGTPLGHVLSGLGVNRLVIAGAQTDFCLGATMYRAVDEGYDVTLVADAHTATDASFDGVGVSAPQIIAITNKWLGDLTGLPGTASIANHDEVQLAS